MKHLTILLSGCLLSDNDSQRQTVSSRLQQLCPRRCCLAMLGMHNCCFSEDNAELAMLCYPVVIAGIRPLKCINEPAHLSMGPQKAAGLFVSSQQCLADWKCPRRRKI